MRFAWVGFHIEGVPALEALVRAGAPVEAVFTLEPASAARRSGAADYHALCRRLGLELVEVRNINDDDAVTRLRALAPDVLFVIGWSQILHPPALRAARLGAIGAHASPLPRLRGSAPVNWTLIRGEPRAGNTLLWLSEDVDAGAIIDQVEFDVTPFDTCATLYERVAESNRDMLLRLLPRLLAGERPGRPQPSGTEPVLPRRRPEHGRIAWDRPARAVYDFVRALTRPYPGAFSFLDGRRWTIWRATLLPPALASRDAPGTVIGPAVSPAPDACGHVVACGDGCIIVNDVEAEDGTRLEGYDLAQQPWRGRRWLDD